MLEFGNTGLDYVVQAAIYGQCIFFMALLYLKNYQLPEWSKGLFYISGFGFIAGVILTNWSIMFYTNTLWVQYTVFVMLATMFFNEHYPIKEAICLGFLTVFLNSYYWELPLHFTDYAMTFPNWLGNMGVFLPQLVRLLPLMYFLPNYTLTSTSKKLLVTGLIFSSILMMIRFTVLRPYGGFIWAINRLVCLLVLVKVILEATRKDTLPTVGRELYIFNRFWHTILLS